MKIANFFRILRGKVTGLNAISARFDVLEMRLALIEQLLVAMETRTLAFPDIQDKLDTIEIGFSASVNAISERIDVLQMQLGLIEQLLVTMDARALAFPHAQDKQNSLQIQETTTLKELSVLESTRGVKTRIVFIVISPEIWSSVAPVWSRAKKDERFDVSVVLLKCANPDIALTSLTKAETLLENAGIPYFTESSFSLENYRPHVVFYPLPYGSLYPNSYKPEVVVAMGCRIAYIPYGLEVGGGVFNARYQYDSEVPRVAWRVFARSQSQLKNFNRYCSYGSGHIVVTGHPRAEIEKDNEIQPHRISEGKARGRHVILWTPHFSVVTRRKWSSFLDHHEKILRLIDDRPDLFLLVRPHPLLRTTLAKLDDWGHERVSAWFSAIDEKDNVHVDTETDYRPAFEASSALMADAGSFLVEYLHTGKPICHLTGKDDIGLSEEVRSLDCFYIGTTEVDIGSFLDRVIKKGEDTLLEARKCALKNYFGVENLSPAGSILNEISNNIGNKSARVYSTELPISPDHAEAFQYWVNAKTTFLGPEAYYQEQEKKIRNILDRYSGGRFAADIGCGNGRFTQILSEYFEFVEATDPNAQLINEACENAKQKGINNIAYSVERLEHAESLSTYDFVCCMGVTSGLIDDEVFIKSIWKLKAAMRPGAKLLLKESLSLSADELVDWNGYRALYRNVESYKGAFQAAGLSLLEEVLVVQDSEKRRVNSFFLFMESARESS
jgi:SAM-dependent methyltransferase